MKMEIHKYGWKPSPRKCDYGLWGDGIWDAESIYCNSSRALIVFVEYSPLSQKGTYSVQDSCYEHLEDGEVTGDWETLLAKADEALDRVAQTFDFKAFAWELWLTSGWGRQPYPRTITRAKTHPKWVSRQKSLRQMYYAMEK